VLRANTLVTIRIHDKVHMIEQNYSSLDQVASSVQCPVRAICYLHLSIEGPLLKGGGCLGVALVQLPLEHRDRILHCE
jgi:hypothetical protein